METRDVKGKWDGKDATFKVRGLTGAEVMDLTDECDMGRAVGKNYVPKLKIGQMRTVTIYKGLVQAPFTIDMEHVRQIDMGTFNALYSAISELTTPTEDFTSPSASPTSKDGQVTLDSQG